MKPDDAETVFYVRSNIIKIPNEALKNKLENSYFVFVRMQEAIHSVHLKVERQI